MPTVVWHFWPCVQRLSRHSNGSPLDSSRYMRHKFSYTPTMADRRRTDPKRTALRERRTLNPRPERVSDALFQQSAFFDARDLPQVKYEMIRRVEVDRAAVADAAAAFGLSRPSFYEARAAVARDGLAGLLPRKRGPREGHKLGPEVMAFIAKRRAADPALSPAALVPLVKKRFAVVVHRRSIERALRRQEKKRP
jgi:transposase